jgi:spoIIIJ-associated protein
MDWVETTGRTVEEARKVALEQLGVEESDADVEVIAEPKIGLFGRLKEEARVRARVKPRYPRSKGERRDRRRSRSGAHDASKPAGEEAATKGRSPAPAPASERSQPGDIETGEEVAPAGGPKNGGGRRRSRAGAGSGRPVPAQTSDAEGTNFNGVTNVPSEEQARLGEEFLRGLLKELGTSANVSSNQSEGTVEISITGDDLGTLIGPKGTTLLALQELTRTVLQRQSAPGESRLVVDINGYRKKRQEALARFARQVADEVVSTNNRRALEPMPAADRKVVHDAVTAIEGVTSISEGEEPNRRVVLMPSGSDSSED